MGLSKKLILVCLLLTAQVEAQCVWTTQFTESYEYTTVVPHVIPGSVYQNTPQTYAGCVHNGNNGLYLNITDGYIGMLYNQLVTDLCPTQSYRFSFWTRDAWSSFNNLTFNVVDNVSGVLLSTITVNNTPNWVNVVMPDFVPVNSAVRFQIITNMIGGPGNDVGFDELKLEGCILSAGTDNAAFFCGAGPVVNMNNYISQGAVLGGVWTENSTSGTFDPATGIWNTTSLNPGSYSFTYAIPANGVCPPDEANFVFILGDFAEVELGNDTNLCSGQTMMLTPGIYDTYLWSNGSTNPSLQVTQPGGEYWVKVGTFGDNQIINGDFELGVNGFNTDYIPGNGGPWGLLSNEGTYSIATSPSNVHFNFNFCNDHTPNPGQNQLVVNGAAVPNTDVWCQTVPVQPDTDYEFGTWVTSVEFGAQPAQLQFVINGTQIGGVFSPSTQGCDWDQFTDNWYSGINTTAQICIVNQNTNGSGNDFALDDITFRPICYSSDTIMVNYLVSPVVNLGVDQSLCEGTPLTLDAQNPGMTYLWNTTENTQTISPTTSGNYSVTVTNAFNCSATDNVNVLFEAPLSAGLDNVDTICSSANTYPLAGLLSAGAAPNGSWELLTAGFAGVVQNGVVSQFANQSGDIDFQYIVQGTFCPNDTALMQLTIHLQPVAAPDVSLHLCNEQGNPVNFSGYLNHPSAPLQGSWEVPATLPAANFNVTSNVFDPGGVQQGNYEWWYILPAETGCVPDTTSILVDITEMPQIQFVADITEGCQPLAVQLTNQSTVSGNTVYNWNLGDGTQSTSSTTVNVVYEAAQCYDITLTATSDGFCTSSLTMPNLICVYPVPLADFYYGPQQIFSDGPTVNFTNTSVNNEFNSWNFGDGGVSSAENPQHTYPVGDIGNYLAELIVTTQYGCSDTTSRIVMVKDQLLYYVPNTFTPDDDEFNQAFLPVFTAGFDPYDFNLQIYNRWGETVFESNDHTVGWDGSYHGSIVPEGTYTWKIQFGMPDTDEVKVITGHINLIR